MCGDTLRGQGFTLSEVVAAGSQGGGGGPQSAPKRRMLQDGMAAEAGLTEGVDAADAGKVHELLTLMAKLHLQHELQLRVLRSAVMDVLMLATEGEVVGGDAGDHPALRRVVPGHGEGRGGSAR